MRDEGTIHVVPLVDRVGTCPSCGKDLFATAHVRVKVNSVKVASRGGLGGNSADTYECDYDMRVIGTRIEHDCEPKRGAR